MCILHIHALFNVYSVSHKPLGFTELKSGFPMQPFFTPLGLIIFLRKCTMCYMLAVVEHRNLDNVVCVDKLDRSVFSSKAVVYLHSMQALCKWCSAY